MVEADEPSRVNARVLSDEEHIMGPNTLTADPLNPSPWTETNAPMDEVSRMETRDPNPTPPVTDNSEAMDLGPLAVRAEVVMELFTDNVKPKLTSGRTLSVSPICW